jgi:hypothetical protein
MKTTRQNLFVLLKFSFAMHVSRTEVEQEMRETMAGAMEMAMAMAGGRAYLTV